MGHEDTRFRDLDRAVISSVDDEFLSHLLELADMGMKYMLLHTHAEVW